MGFSNGNLTSNVVKVQKGNQGERGIGFHLTADNHYHIRDKRLTNVAAPVDDHDVAIKTFVIDLLKTKAGTTYVSNELAKKANKSTLSNYALRSDLNKAISDLNKAISDLNTAISAIKPKV